VEAAQVESVAQPQPLIGPQLQEQDLPARRARLLAADALLAGLAAVQLDAAAAARFGHGQRVAAPAPPAPARLRVYDAQGRLLGLGRSVDGWIEAVRLVAQPPEPAPGAMHEAPGTAHLTGHCTG